jgi:hypothetical protein
MTIVNDDSSIINKLETSLIDNARVVIYDCHMFIVQATYFVSLLRPNIIEGVRSTKHAKKACYIQTL